MFKKELLLELLFKIFGQQRHKSLKELEDENLNLLMYAEIGLEQIAPNIFNNGQRYALVYKFKYPKEEHRKTVEKKINEAIKLIEGDFLNDIYLVPELPQRRMTKTNMKEMSISLAIVIVFDDFWGRRVNKIDAIIVNAIHGYLEAF